MIQNNEKGFTLVELLVTVGIIGILATITVASLSGTRSRARDAQRISDVKQLATILDSELSANPGSDEKGIVLQTTEAGGTDCAVKDKTTSCLGPGKSINEAFTKFKDPKTGLAACGAVAAGNPATTAAQCEYTISSETGAAKPQTGDYQLCFVLEADSGIYKKGMNRIINGGKVEQMCK